MKNITRIIFATASLIMLSGWSSKAQNTHYELSHLPENDKEESYDKDRYWPHTRRLDRQIKSGSIFGFKGEYMLGLTASYGTLTSDESDFYVYLDNINLEGALTTIKPFFGYYYRDNRCLGVRMGYQYLNADLGSLDLDLGEQNDISLNMSGLKATDDSYSFSLFHRSYYAIDKKGQFGVFAEVEATAQFGRGEFINGSGEDVRYTESKTTKLKLGFSPGLAAYIFPQVCATVSIGLGGVRYTSIEQFDDEGQKIGTRTASKMQFRLNVADINFGMTFHLWNKKKMQSRY